MVARGFDESGLPGDDGSGFGIDVLVTAEVAGVVIDDVVRCSFSIVGWRRRQPRGVAGEEFGVVFDVRGDAEFAPVIGDGADAVGADGDDLLDLLRGEGGEAGFGEGLEGEVVAEPAGWVAGTSLFLEDAEGGAEVGHDAGEVGDDLAAVGIVGAHAAEPKAVLLGAIEDGQVGSGNEFVALGCGQAEGVAGFFECQEELGAVGIFPRAGVCGSAAQADDNGQVLDADRTLVLACAAGGALVGGLHAQGRGRRMSRSLLCAAR